MGATTRIKSIFSLETVPIIKPFRSCPKNDIISLLLLTKVRKNYATISMSSFMANLHVRGVSSHFQDLLFEGLLL